MARRGRINLTRPVNWNHPLNQGRILWLYGLPQWAAGKTWFDLCRQSNGSLSSPAMRATTPYGTGIDCNGSTTVDCGSGRIPAFGTSLPFTVALWAKWTTTSVGVLLSTESGISPAAGFDLIINSAAFTYGSGGSGSAGVRVAGTTGAGGTGLNDGAWHRLVGVRAGGTLSFYVDGRLRVSGATLVDSATPSANLYVGSRNGATFATAALADVTILTVGWTDAQVALDYAETRVGYPTALARTRPAAFSTQSAGNNLSVTLTQAANTATGTIENVDHLTAALTQSANSASGTIGNLNSLSVALSQVSNTASGTLSALVSITATLPQSSDTAVALLSHPVLLSADLTQDNQSVSALIYHGTGPTGDSPHLLLKGAT